MIGQRVKQILSTDPYGKHLSIMLVVGVFSLFLFFYFWSNKIFFEGTQVLVSEGGSLRIASVFKRSSDTLDPTRISSFEEYELIYNLYGRLVEYDKDNTLRPSVAKSFYWEGNSLVFTFEDKRVSSVDGHSVMARDAYISLKRAIIFQKTGHGDLRRFLCPGFVIKSVNDDCPGIKIVGKSKLVLTPAEPFYAPFLLAVLDNADFSIIPETAFDDINSSLTIRDHKNTSGAYYISEDNGGGDIVLDANPFNPKFSREMPGRIRLVPVQNSAIEALRSRQVDYLPASTFSNGEDLISEARNKDSQFSVHETVPTRVKMFCFSPKALSRFTVEQRLFVASLLQEYQSMYFATPSSKETVEFFQGMSEGGLDQSQRDELKNMRKSIKRPKFSRPMTVWSSSQYHDQLVSFLKPFPEVRVERSNVHPLDRSIDDRPDVYTVFSDSAWTESISLLGHNFGIGIFHLPDTDSDKWMSEYLRIEDRKARISHLRDLHFKLLSSVSIYPFSVSPFFAVARKPWLIDFSPFVPGSELWKIRKGQ